MNALGQFRSEQRGSVAIMFAFAIVPVLLAVGMAVEFAHTNHTRVRMQAAADSATLAVATQSSTLNDAAAAVLARTYFDANFPPDGDVTLTSVEVVRALNKVSVVAKGSVRTGLLGIAQASQTNVGVESHASWTTNKIEVALVLDNTGSMSSNNKMTELKAAAKSLVEILEKAAYEKGAIKVSLVPFNTQVKTGFTGANAPNWVQFAAGGGGGLDLNGQSTVTQSDWKGCVTDREQPNDVNDAEATGAARHLAVECEQASLAAIMPLTDDLSAGGPLQKAIAGMTPVGNTNVTIGIAHGLATLSPAAPYTGAAAYGTKNLEKYMIVLTDGDNTKNRFSSNGNTIDLRTKAACAEAKANSPVAKNIRLYTIRVINGDADLLRGCASSPDMFKDVRSAADLHSVFQAIANEIAGVRLTQ